MAFIDEILQTPSYGWMDAKGLFLKPTTRQLFKEAFSRINIFKSRKNWIALISWFMATCMLPLFVIFLMHYLSWKSAIVLVVICHGYHEHAWNDLVSNRHCTHKSYKFSHPIFRFDHPEPCYKNFSGRDLCGFTSCSSCKIFDEPGDPYNPMGGFMYCMLSDVNHQSIAKGLNRDQYHRVRNFSQSYRCGIKFL